MLSVNREGSAGDGATENTFYLGGTHLHGLKSLRAQVLSLNSEGGGGGGGCGGGKLAHVVRAVFGAVHAHGQLPIVAWEKEKEREKNMLTASFQSSPGRNYGKYTILLEF